MRRKHPNAKDDLLPEYDFDYSKAELGKYAKKLFARPSAEKETSHLLNNAKNAERIGSAIEEIRAEITRGKR